MRVCIFDVCEPNLTCWEVLGLGKWALWLASAKKMGTLEAESSAS